MSKLEADLETSGETLYHGTGFLAHEFEGSSYDGKPTGKVRRVVDEILTNGLQPFHDPLNTDGGSSISLTEDPLYAVLYALCYAEKGTAKSYMKGRGEAWFRILFQITCSIIKNKYRGVVKDPSTPTAFQKHNTLDKAPKWAHTFNNEDYNSRYAAIGGLRAFYAMIYGESNIPGNYPVVIATKASHISKSIPGWSEVRTRSKIDAKEFTGIYVPESKMADYNNKPVFSLEKLIKQSLQKR